MYAMQIDIWWWNVSVTENIRIVSTLSYGTFKGSTIYVDATIEDIKKELGLMIRHLEIHILIRLEATITRQSTHSPLETKQTIRVELETVTW